MNAILLGTASLGALFVLFTSGANSAGPAQAVTDDTEVARLMEAAPDVGAFEKMTFVDPETGKITEATVLVYKD
jgi:hypothetical protein